MIVQVPLRLPPNLAAAALVERLPGVSAATCVLASRIGAPVDQPRLVDVGLETLGGEDPAVHRAAAEQLLVGELAGIAALWRALLEHRIPLF